MTDAERKLLLATARRIVPIYGNLSKSLFTLDAEIAAVEAEQNAASAAQPVAEWQPIATAPKDGTEIDLWASGRRWTDCHWHLGEWLRWQSDSVDEEPTHKRIANPTHWQPLPLPPIAGIVG